MAANIRYTSTYYNTTESGSGNKTMRLEILDTEAVAGVINFECVNVKESFEGITEDLKPGIYPSRLQFGMYIRESPINDRGVTYGPSHSFVSDILTAKEGRFLVRLFQNNVLQFIGPIIYDQCSYEDMGQPYLFNITAVDGLVRWTTTDYVSEVGQIVYESQEDSTGTWDTVPLGYSGSSNQAITIEHRVERIDGNHDHFYVQNTTFAYREVYSKNSPGTGWVDQGAGKWHKQLSYTNEVETEVTNYSYHLTRDIDDDAHRNISEFIQRAISETNITDEFPGVMYDVSDCWYDHDMENFTDDPTTMTRLHEGVFIGGTWKDGMEEICRIRNWRIYFSKGRFHFEQISMRDATTLKRFIYNADGTSAGAAETASLDINFNTYPIKPEAGGTTKFLAPFRSVEATLSLDKSNLLDGAWWQPGKYGEKYLGRIKKTAENQHMVVNAVVALTSTFDPSIFAVLDDATINSVCKHKFQVYWQIRITNVSTGVSRYLTDDGDSRDSWSTTPYTFETSTPFGHGDYTYSGSNYGYTRNARITRIAEDLPAPEDAMYDVHMSISFGIEWDTDNGAHIWEDLNPDGHWHTLNTTNTPSEFFINYRNTMKFYSDVTVNNFVESTDTIASEKYYYNENDTDNSIDVKIKMAWGDSNQFEKGIQIYDGTDWINSSGWSIDGAGTAQELGALLVDEIMKFRMYPRLLYSGSFVTSLVNAENRFQRNSYFYLPLSCSRDTGYDTFEGEFLQIESSTPNTGGEYSVPHEGNPTQGPTMIGDSSPDSPFEVIDVTFETDAAITASSTLTEVAIVNTSGVFIQEGTIVTIVHPTSGVKENVVLSADINPTDTVMYFDSHTFGFSFPDASFIIPQMDAGLFPTSLDQVYYFFKSGYTATSISAPNFVFVDEEEVGLHDINKRYKLKRNGTQIFCKFGVTDPAEMIQTYYFDKDAKTWNFYGDGLEGETIQIEAF